MSVPPNNDMESIRVKELPTNPPAAPFPNLTALEHILSICGYELAFWANDLFCLKASAHTTMVYKR